MEQDIFVGGSRGADSLAQQSSDRGGWLAWQAWVAENMPLLYGVVWLDSSRVCSVC